MIKMIKMIKNQEGDTNQARNKIQQGDKNQGDNNQVEDKKSRRRQQSRMR